MVRAVQWGKQEDFHATFRAGRRDSGLQGYRKVGIRDWRDRRLEEYRIGGFMKGGIQYWRDTGKEGFGTGGIQDWGIKERRDSGLEGFGTGGIKDWRDTGNEGLQGYIKRGIQSGLGGH